jgi:hypothetical protein
LELGLRIGGDQTASLFLSVLQEVVAPRCPQSRAAEVLFCSWMSQGEQGGEPTALAEQARQ